MTSDAVELGASGADPAARSVHEAIVIVNERGLHARASAKFVNAVARLPAGITVTVAKDGIDANGGSILGLMMLGAARGDTITLTITGPADEVDGVLLKLGGVIKDGFGED